MSKSGVGVVLMVLPLLYSTAMITQSDYSSLQSLVVRLVLLTSALVAADFLIKQPFLSLRRFLVLVEGFLGRGMMVNKYYVYNM
jgi:hypothetical protein